MQLDELVKEETIRDIVNRTHISKNLLDRLTNKKFSELNKTQVMGIVSILEREYGVELNEIKEEANQYFKDEISDSNRFVVAEPVVRDNNFLFKFFVLVLIGMIAYGSWYFFSSYYKPAPQDIVPTNDKSLLDIIIAGKDTIMDKVNGKSSKETPVVMNVSEDQVAIVQSTPVESIKTKEEPTSTQETKENNDKAQETTQKTIDESIDESRATTQEQDNNNEENSSTVVSEKKNIIATKQESDSTKDTLATQREKITILPQKIMLFQLVNLKTKKELRFKRKEQYDINVKDHGWLFSSKNSVFAFVDNDIFEEYGGKGKIFFRLDQDGIHQLSEDEYKKALRR